jgi:hypothetical protein
MLMGLLDNFTSTECRTMKRGCEVGGGPSSLHHYLSKNIKIEVVGWNLKPVTNQSLRLYGEIMMIVSNVNR